jgi:hypothetical protein
MISQNHDQQMFSYSGVEVKGCQVQGKIKCIKSLA